MMTSRAPRAPQGGGPSRSARGADTALSLATTAMGLFLERGYANVTVEDVARVAGVSRRTVFRYFPSKDELPFPDHVRRRAQAQAMLDEPGRGADPVGDIIEVTMWALADFLESREFVLQRYALTRVEPQLADREVLEHEKYLVASRAHLHRYLPSTAKPFEAMAIAAFIDGVHRSALSNWARSGGTSDALAEMRSGADWVQRALAAADDAGRTTALLAVVPNTPAVRRRLQEIVELGPGRES